MKTLKALKTLKKTTISSVALVCVLLAMMFTITDCDKPTDGTDETSDFTVSYDVGTGSGTAPANQTIASGKAFYLPGQGNMTAPSGQTFNGWRTNGQNYSAGDNFTVTGNTIFLAQWLTTTGPFTVSYNVGAGSGTPPASQIVASGNTIYLPDQESMIAPSGQPFNGWKANNHNYAAGTSFIVTGHTIFSAQWTGGGSGVFNVSLQAKPVPAPGTPKVLASYTDGVSNRYLVDVGYISDMYISTIAAVDYTGVPIDFTKTITTTETYTTSLSKTVSDSVTVSDTDNTKIGVGVELKAKFPIVDVTLKGNYEWSWTDTTSQTSSKSTSNTATTATQYAESQTVKYQFGTNDHPLGKYRYAIYGVCDVYFILETSLDNQTLLGWETNVCARPNDYFMRSEYAADGVFTNEPTHTIDFTEDFYKHLESSNTFALSFDTDGGTAVNPRNVTAGTSLPLAAVVAPTRVGYVFAGWDTHGYTAMPNKPLTITAKWLAISQRMDFNVGNSLTVDDWYRTDYRLISLPLAELKEMGYMNVSFEWKTYWAEADNGLDCTAHVVLDYADINKIHKNGQTYFDEVVNPGVGWKWVTWKFSPSIDTVKAGPYVRCAYGYDKRDWFLWWSSAFYKLSGTVSLTVTAVK
jgi:uncharacterized repeat protein (TIGR02543 family)